MKAAFLDFATVGSDEIDVAPLEGVTDELTVFDNTAPNDITDRIAGCEFVYINKVRMTRDIFAAAPDLRFVGLIATGVDNVDLDAAKEHGVAVCNIRAYCTRSVVEHVFAVLLNLTHSIGRYNTSVRAGDWQKATDFCMLGHPIRELSAMTMGIIGYGELGKAVANVAQAFGMTVMIGRRPGSAPSDGDGRVDLDLLLKSCDVVSLHCPLTDETRGLIGKDELEQMKSSAILINTARGRLVDSTALSDALANGAIAAAGIDVLSQEPPIDGDPLLDYKGENLIVTPHTAWATVEARQNAINEVAANARAFLNGEKRNRVA